MADRISSQHVLDEVRKPRVQITYDVVISDTVDEKRELPLVVGVMADLFGHKDENGLLKDRTFTKLNSGNFDQFMNSVAPELQIEIRDTQSQDPKAVKNLDLKLRKMGDFNPDNFIKQDAPMNELLKKRHLLTELLAKLDGNPKLVNSLIESLKDPAKAKELAAA